MATTASELGALLPVLIGEISRLKQLHSLAGIAELPVKDVVVREELAKLRSDFAQIKSLFGGASAMMTAESNRAPTTEATERRDEEGKGKGPPTFGAAPLAKSRLLARPRLGSRVNTSTLPLPDSCDTHFFLVSTNTGSANEVVVAFWLIGSRACLQTRATSRRPDRIRWRRWSWSCSGWVSDLGKVLVAA